jgi:hypothetical protein
VTAVYDRRLSDLRICDIALTTATIEERETVFTLHREEDRRALIEQVNGLLRVIVRVVRLRRPADNRAAPMRRLSRTQGDVQPDEGRQSGKYRTERKSMAKARRTTHRSKAGKKLYAVRDAKGKFKDIQTYERSNRADLARKSKAEKKS